MLFHITEQFRKWNVSSIFNFVAVFLYGRGWSRKEALSVVKGQTAPCNVLDILKEILTPDKKYTFGEHTDTGAKVMEKVELYLLKNDKAAKKCKAISDGRHRAVALCIAAAYGGEDFVIEPNEVQIEKGEVRSDSFEENVKHDYATKLSKIDKLQEVLGLIDAKEAQKEADIQKLGLTRYQAQEFWAKAMLVRQHDFSIEDAAALKKEDARKASATADAKTYLAENGKAGSNTNKVVAGKVIREMQKLLVEGGVSSENAIRRLVDTLAHGDEVAFRDICFQTIKEYKNN